MHHERIVESKFRLVEADLPQDRCRRYRGHDAYAGTVVGADRSHDHSGSDRVAAGLSQN